MDIAINISLKSCSLSHFTLHGLLDSISAVMVTGFPTFGGSGLTVRLLTLKMLLEPVV